jgi:hypothetical protein
MCLAFMGNFYTNYTLRGPSQSAVAAALAGRSAIVTPKQDGSIIVFDEQCVGGAAARDPTDAGFAVVLQNARSR